MNKYIEPKLVGFDGKQYLNIDFSDTKYEDVLAIRIENILFINMRIGFSSSDSLTIPNFLRNIKISEGTHFGVCNKHTPVSGGGLGGNNTVRYNASTNSLGIRSSTTQDSASITFILMLPIEEGY